MQEGGRRFDPLALAVLGAAVLVLVALVAGLVYSIRSAPPVPVAPAAPKAAPAGPSIGDRIADLTRQVAKEIADAVREDRPMKVPAAPKPPPAAKLPPSAKASPPAAAGAKRAGYTMQKLPAGQTWVYRVELTPPVWRDATLSYRTVEQVKGMTVYTEFRHAGGKGNFTLGTLEAGHPSHANTRFPGFFLYAAYLDKPLDAGQRFAWQWPWQMPDGKVRSGRVKRYDAIVAGWENLPAADSLRHPGGVLPTARLEARLQYVEDGKVLAEAKETFWVAPRYGQIVKLVREGRTPDEGSQRIVAELVEFR